MCIGCPRGWICCGRAWGKCICKKPGWNSCCTRTIDPACKSANAACSLLKSRHGVSTNAKANNFFKEIGCGIKEGVKKAGHGIKKGFKKVCHSIKNRVQQVRHGIKNTSNKVSSGIRRGFQTVTSVALKTLNEARDSLNKAEDVLKKARDNVSFAKKAWYEAKKALNDLKKTVGAIALKTLKTLSSNKIINIIEMNFKVELRKAVGGRFECEVKGILFGKHFSKHLDFDTRNILSLAKSLADKAIRGLSKFIG